MSIESVMPSNHLILCHPLLPSIFPSIMVFSNESVLHIMWPKCWSFSFSISPSNEYSRLISFRIDWLDLLAVQGTLRVFSNTIVQKHQFFDAQLSLWSNSHPLSLWCHPTISSSIIPFSSHLQFFPASGSFQMSQFFTSGGHSIVGLLREGLRKGN